MGHINVYVGLTDLDIFYLLVPRSIQIDSTSVAVWFHHRTKWPPKDHSPFAASRHPVFVLDGNALEGISWEDLQRKKTTTFSGKGPELQGQFAGSLHWALCLQGSVPMAKWLDSKWRWDVDWKWLEGILHLSSTLKSLKVFVNNGNTSIHRKLYHIHLDWLPSMIPWLWQSSQTRFLALFEFPLDTIDHNCRIQDWTMREHRGTSTSQ